MAGIDRHVIGLADRQHQQGRDALVVRAVVQRDDSGAVRRFCGVLAKLCRIGFREYIESPSMTDSMASAQSFAAWPIISCA